MYYIWFRFYNPNFLFLNWIKRTMKILYLVILLLIFQSDFCFANRVSFQNPLGSSSYRKTSEIFLLSNNKTREKKIIKPSNQRMSNNFVNTKNPFSRIISPFNILMLLLFFIFYIVFVCIIKLVQRHYMELEWFFPNFTP